MLVESTDFNYRVGLILGSIGCNWQDAFSTSVTKTLFRSIVKYLAELRSKEDKSYAVVLRSKIDDDSPITFAFVLEKHTSDEGKSYSLSFTFDPDDIPSDAEIITVTSPEAVAFLNEECDKDPIVGFKFNGEVEAAVNLHDVLTAVVTALKEYSRAHVRDNVPEENKNIEFKGYFTVTAIEEEDPESEGNEKRVFVKITPSEELKQIIKDDSSIENKYKKPEAESSDAVLFTA